MIIRLFVFSLLYLALTAQAAETRALKIIATDPATKQTGEVTLYNKSVAVIIGIDQYANLPADKQLTYAVKDAKGVADVLKRQYKFDKIITLYNKEATRDRILDLLTEELPNQLSEQDALFIFWAGHGNQETSREGDLGYLIPYDGNIKKLRTNISMTEIRDNISKKIPAKHIFYVMDACYSGMLTETRAVDKTPRRDLAYLQDITKERVRQVLTAGGKGQEVLDGGNNGHSVFTGRLIELLEKTGDFITANEIQAIIKEKVNGDARARNHQQTPSYGTLYGSGDFVFIPSLEQKVADNRAEIAKLEAELKAMDAAAAKAKLSAGQAEQARLQRNADLWKATLAGKLKAEQIKQDQLAAEEKRRQDEETERQRMLAAKGEDEKRLVALKAAADARRKANVPQSAVSDFPTVESAIAEIKRLNARINTIEAGYEKELTQTRAKVIQRYQTQLAVLDKAKPDEFENPAEFKIKQAKQRSELESQREAELSRLNVAELSVGETAPLRDSIQQLADREYTIGAESITAELGAYDAEAHQFTISLKSKTPIVKLAMNGTIPLSPAEAKAFKQQWLAGLVRPEAKVKNSKAIEVSLIDDVDGTQFAYLGGTFLTPRNRKVLQESEELLLRPDMVTVPAGSYSMGVDYIFRFYGVIDGLGEKPAHGVTFNKPFLMSKTEVTQGQWKTVMGTNPSHFMNCGDACPVDRVSWFDAQEYIKKLNIKTGKQYRLPTEAEWEYACRAGANNVYCGSDDEEEVGWCASNSETRTHIVGSKKANNFGLYDMNGNVQEWVEDSVHDDYIGAPTDGSSWLGNVNDRILRGGSWRSVRNITTQRNRSAPNLGSGMTGFRIAHTLQ